MCGFPLNETEKDDILAGLAEGIRPRVICVDCKEGEMFEEDEIDDSRIEDRLYGDLF